MQLREFLGILRERWITWVAATVAALVGAGVASVIATPVYQASTRIFVAAQGTGYVVTEDDLRTYVELVRSPVVLEPLRERLGLAPGTPIDVSAGVAGNSNMLDITARASDPQQAADIANAVGPQLTEIGGRYSPLLASAGQDVEATAITPATAPPTPVSPNTPRNLALGLLAGLGLGIGLALLQHFLDTKVRGEDNIRALSGRPILGALQKLKDPEKNRLVVDTMPRSLAAEEYRRLRTNLQFVDVTTGGKHSFVVSSAVPGEGKTTTAVNLALAMADSGARVLLVDADLRNPSVAATMGLEGSVGLTTILLGRATVDEVAQPWHDTTLSVLAAGEIPPNPSELLGSAAVKELFTALLASYDWVIVDSPPIVPVSDPLLINTLVGGLLMVVGVGNTNTRDLAAALKSVDTVGADVAGFALNLVPRSNSRYGYGYGYGHKRATDREGSADDSATGESADEDTPARARRAKAPRPA